MRKLISLILLAGASTGTIAVAHPLPGDPALAEQLLHRGLSLHHAPMVILLLIAAALLVLSAKAWTTRNKH
ncbi:MAG: hypothetical protein OEW68_04860 [Gammaproteobacteria bacterium]|nr:hypothetical protein [Gammaproteobacteria bacterium]MDH4314153.1 hypothetical protein [Gammaproteobacteria bacterium]MDH5212793.1 hypothetical protein [Gammaproteobacteria bacterium]MDH5499983.1 hypothetical protein [Gammaproteobacteria bacterium]